MRFRPPGCQDEPQILAFPGGKCLYSGEFQSSMMTQGLVRKGGRGAEEIYPCKKHL